jgi:hypothetical protein
MSDDLGEAIKKYVKEAIHEYFIEIWQEFGEKEFPYPLPPPFLMDPRRYRQYREVYDRFEGSVDSLSHSVQFLRSFALKVEDWNAECSEKQKIEKLTEDMSEIKEAMSEIRDLLKQIALK